jgi:glycosyltransferase involved in cell wall biosynthesis
VTSLRPVVSIITPTFRHQQFIDRCVRSVLAQTYGSWELIVIDDASPDNTAGIVEGFTAQDRRIHLIRHTSNSGAARLSETYNEGLRHCQGKLIAILEGDDEWTPEKLARQVSMFDDNRVVLCYSDYDEITADGILITRHGLSDAPGVGRSGLPENLRFFSALKSFGANTVMVRHQDLLSIGGFVHSGLPFVDYPTWLRLVTRGDFVRLPAVLGSWRRHGDSVYWANEYATLELLAEHFLSYLSRERGNLLGHGIAGKELEALALNAHSALTERKRGRLYFEGKYHLLLGQRTKAIGRFVHALVAPGVAPRHRLGALVGMAAAATSPRLILALSRMAQFPRSGQ